MLTVAAALGLLIAWGQLAALWKHLRGPRAVPGGRPGISILKPLCGLDDRLAGNLLSFADLPYANYEVLLGLRSADDAAYALAWMATRRWPHRFRIVLQQGEVGLNPKVNQLVTLARHARHDILVISDSNTRVEPDYLDDIAAHLEDPTVGLVTHLLAGEGETESDTRLGAIADNLHITGVITPGVVAAKLLAGKDYVIGKSMAMRRADLEALGGFESVKNVLAEDFVLGRAVAEVLGQARGPRAFDREVRFGPARARRLHPALCALERDAAPVRRPARLSRPAARKPDAAGDDGGGDGAGRADVRVVARLRHAAAWRPTRWRAGCSAAARFPFVCCSRAASRTCLSGAAWVYGLVSRSIEWRSNRLVVSSGSRLRIKQPRGGWVKAFVARAGAAR